MLYIALRTSISIRAYKAVIYALDGVYYRKIVKEQQQKHYFGVSRHLYSDIMCL